MSKDDVGIKIYQHTLALKGQRTLNAEVKEDRYHRVERAYGPFQQSLRLCQLVGSLPTVAYSRHEYFSLTSPL